jgi:hypothetical protein
VKRFLLFILLFGGALLVLRQLEGPRPTELPLPPPSDEGTGEGTPPPDRRQGLSLSGRFVTRIFDEETGGATLVMESEDSRSLGDRDELLRVELQALDRAGEEVQVECTAGIARFRRRGVTEDLLPEFEGRTEFVDLHAVLLAGAPMVPMIFDAPTAELDVRDVNARTLRTTDHIVIESARFGAEGDGLVVLLDGNSFSLLANSVVSLRQSEGNPVELSSAGPIDIRREDVGGGGEEIWQIQIDAREKAALDFSGEEGSRLTARHIKIIGRESADDDSAFLIERMEAEGEVVWISADTIARGRRAEMRFTPDGKLASWELEDQPSIETSIASLEGVESPPFSPLEDPQRVILTGEGPLTGEASGIRGFRMRGPAIVEARDATLHSAGEISGWIAEAGESAEFQAIGGVLLESDRDTLETTELTLGFQTLPSGDPVQRAVTGGGTRLVGTLQDGRPFSVTSPRGIEIERTGEHWRVREAEQVVLIVEGPEGFEARADRVQDFDPSIPYLIAEGNVSVESAAGSSRGERLIVEEADHFRFEGTAENKASFVHPAGRAEALEVTVLGNSFRAVGAVDARLRRPVGAGEGEEPADEVYHIRCDDLEMSANEERGAGSQTVLRESRLEARGGVDARIARGRESTTLLCDHLIADRFEHWRGPDGAIVLIEATTAISADGKVEGFLSLEDSDLDIDCGHLEVDRSEIGPEGARYQMTATREVRFDLIMRGLEIEGEEGADPDTVTLSGEGEQLTLDETLSGALSPIPGGRVRVIGSLLSQNAPFELLADRIGFSGARRMEAWRPELVMWSLEDEIDDLPFEATGLLARAGRMVATPESLDLIDNVVISSATPAGAPWSLAADQIRLAGKVAARVEDAQVETLNAQGEVTFRLGIRGAELDKETVATARGDALTANSIYGTLRLIGQPARVTSPAFISESEWIEFDPQLRIIVATGAGRVLPSNEIGRSATGNWGLEFLASETRIEPDSLIYVIEEPLFRYPDQQATLHATWAMFWFDRDRWMNLPARLETPDEETEPIVEAPPRAAPAESPLSKMYELLNERNVGELVREIYLEGPIEVLERDDLVARAGAIYSDLATGEGWIVDAHFNVFGEAIGEEFDKLVVHADWVRHTHDGSLRASGATITTSSVDSPSVCLITGDMRIVPRPEGDENSYQIMLRDNRIELFGWLSIPLPPITYGAGDDYKPAWQTLRIADSARFGTFVSAGISRPAGDVGELINKALGGDPQNYDASWSLHASYLGSRGALFDIGLDVKSAESYGLDMEFGIVPDTGNDRGYVRVDQHDRDTVRRWFRADTRFEISDREWVDLVLSSQSDPGVQSEFWEGDFERYERDESYVQWRRARGENYFDATVKTRIDRFRSDVDELPSAGVYFGRTPLLQVGSRSLLHSAELRAAWLDRRSGRSGEQSPFSSAPALDEFDTFADGFGDRDLARLDFNDTIEIPLDVGFGGLRATPFVEGRFTSWSEGENRRANPTRFFLEGGARVATTFWRRGVTGKLHSLSPFVEFRDQLALEQHGDPVRFDVTENALGGNRLAFGLRGRFGLGEKKALLDFELRATHATDLPGGREDGWLPGEVFARLEFEPWGIPVLVWHDARYDLDDHRTPYSLTATAFRITENFRLEAGHHYARDAADSKLFEAASISGIYRWSEKWEFEGKETFSLIDQNALDTRVVLRRFGADMIFELQSSVREGEGGASLSVSVRPRFGWRPSRIGYLNY